jgi:hypothetical protein
VQRNLDIYNNTFIATTGPGLATQAYGARISYVNPGGQMNNAGIILQNNLIKAVVTTSDPTYTAQALLVDGVDAGINLMISSNTLESNDISLALGGGDGSDDYGVQFISNTLRKSSDGAARSYTGILSGFWIRQVHNISLIDMRVANGATSTIVWQGTGTKDLEVGWLLTVNALNSAGAVLPGAAITVTNQAGTQVYNGTAGNNGQIANIAVVATIYTQATSNPGAITTSSQGPFEITITANGHTMTQSVSLNADLTTNIIVY